jgi:hypothetical protein
MATNWKTVGAIIGVFWMGNFLTVGFHNYFSASERARDATVQIGSAKLDCQLQSAVLQNERDVAMAKSDTLDKQNRDQQGTINGCLSRAIKLVTPVTPQLNLQS